jgi:hypothetical protein
MAEIAKPTPVKCGVDYAAPLQDVIRRAVYDALVKDSVREAIEKIAIAEYALAYDGDFDTPLCGSLASQYREQAKRVLLRKLA